MKKKIIALLLCSCMVINLCACQSTDSNTTENSNNHELLNNVLDYATAKLQDEEFQDELRIILKDSLKDLIGAELTPHITDVEVNDDFTEYTIYTTSSELDTNESNTTFVTYLYGIVYGVLKGEFPDHIVVTFINSDSGEVIEELDSYDMRISDLIPETTE